jgi:hypothetical protein
MAYFANGTEGMVFDKQCAKCKYGDKPCPIALDQFTYNYDACNNKVASNILDILVSDNGTCEMYKNFEDDFKLIEPDAEQIELGV